MFYEYRLVEEKTVTTTKLKVNDVIRFEQKDHNVLSVDNGIVVFQNVFAPEEIFATLRQSRSDWDVFSVRQISLPGTLQRTLSVINNNHTIVRVRRLDDHTFEYEDVNIKKVEKDDPIKVDDGLVVEYMTKGRAGKNETTGIVKLVSDNQIVLQMEDTGEFITFTGASIAMYEDASYGLPTVTFTKEPIT